MMYEHQASTTSVTAAAFLALLNAEGANGYRYVMDQSFAGEGNAIKSLLVKDAETTYSYEIVAPATTAAEFVAQANAQGARGFQFAGPYSQGFLYRKNNNVSAAYSYFTEPSQPAAAKFLAQANAQGANGNRYVMEYAFGSAFTSVYEKGASGTYSFEVLANPVTDDAFLAQLNAQGAKGFRFQTPYVFSADGTAIANIYVKDTAQSATFSVLLRDYLNTSAPMLAQANAEGAKGNALLGLYALPSGAFKNIYFNAANCTGLLCDARNPFGF